MNEAYGAVFPSRRDESHRNETSGVALAGVCARWDCASSRRDNNRNIMTASHRATMFIGDLSHLHAGNGVRAGHLTRITRRSVHIIFVAMISPCDLANLYPADGGAGNADVRTYAIARNGGFRRKPKRDLNLQHTRLRSAIISGFANRRVGRLKAVVSVYVKHCLGESYVAENARAVNPRLWLSGRINICKMSVVTNFIIRPVFSRVSMIRVRR